MGKEYRMKKESFSSIIISWVSSTLANWNVYSCHLRVCLSLIVGSSSATWSQRGQHTPFTWKYYNLGKNREHKLQCPSSSLFCARPKLLHQPEHAGKAVRGPDTRWKSRVHGILSYLKWKSTYQDCGICSEVHWRRNSSLLKVLLGSHQCSAL